MSAVFEHSSTVVLFDYFRVPSRPADGPPARAPVTSGLLEAFSWIRSVDSGRLLLWPDDDLMSAAAPDPVTYQLRSMELYGRVLPDSTAVNLLGETWIRNDSIHDRKGHDLSSVWSDRDGNIFLPFDPNEAVTAFWQEAYSVRALLGTDRLTALSQAAYYYVRPVLPRNVQVRLRRLLRRVQEQLPFPRWPIEPSLHDLYAYLFGLCAEAAGGSLPVIAPWPHDHRWALVLTHDVETLSGYRNVHLLRHLELDAGYRSSWNFVPRRYRVDDRLVRELLDEGFEVGIHGLDHDGRDLKSLAILSSRLPLMQDFAKRWNAVGFRSPATQRVWEWMPLLGFDYDSSYPDTDPYEPQPGGCCSWLPFFNDGLVELPITLPQDYTLFTILQHENAQLWLEKTEFLRERGGMALMITHPDYMLERRPRNAYRELLDAYRDDPTVWRALPCEVSSWWRRRAASRLERAGGEWRIAGPAADAGRVVYY